MKYNFLFSLTFLLFFKGFSQNNQEFNLPPGSVINKKAETNKDFSAKLNLVMSGNFENSKAVEGNFLNQYTASEIEAMMTESPESYSYYKKADEFYKKLSPRVKAVFTVDDLWNIYMFNQKLKSQLAEIK